MRVDKLKLNIAMAAKCWGVIELSNESRITSTTLYAILKGRSARVKTIGKIAKALEISPTEILKDD